ncbi:MAG: YidC/Oxa1 family membrane protein insertase [Capsulimonadaceae bacterium]|nr:YidC/Oxa1 family membrane protein insertase [Capsulimonadaceae bacterium]
MKVTNLHKSFELSARRAAISLIVGVFVSVACFAQSAPTSVPAKHSSRVAAHVGFPAHIKAPAATVPAPAGVPESTIAIYPNEPMPSLGDLTPPPAFSIAIDLFNKGDYAGAAAKLEDVQKSATYRSTAYAPAALYRVAQIQRDYLHQDMLAMQQYATLVNQYAHVEYPGSATVEKEKYALSQKIDHDNSAKPLYKLIDFCVNLTGAQHYSYWLALAMIAILVRLILTPLTIKQYKGMREMQRLQPLLKEIQAKYDKDPALKNQKMMELYKEHNASPMSGCGPMLLQLPVYYYMYQAIVQYQYHFSHGTFLWINGATATWAQHIYPGVVGRNLAEQDMILLFIYSISMYVTQRMMPATDPTQAESQKMMSGMMSVFFFIMFIQWHFPSAFVLYWLFSNILGTATQMYFMKQGDSTPPGSTPLLPPDGEIASRNGNGKSLRLSGDGATASSDAAPARRTSSAKPAGASRGVIAPKNHPKKKRR